MTSSRSWRCLLALTRRGATADNGDVDTLTLDWGRGCVARLLGRNQLVRRSDRWEVLSVALVVSALLLAIPVVAALGTAIKESRSHAYAEQAITRQQTSGTALADARLHVLGDSQAFGGETGTLPDDGVHLGTVAVPDMVRVGDHVEVWIDRNGNHVGAPSPPGQAAAEAVGWAALSWIALAGVSTAGLFTLRRVLNRARYAAWDRELIALAGNDDGRASHGQ